MIDSILNDGVAWERWCERIGWALVHSTWQFSAIAAATAVLMSFAGGRAASRRYGLLVVATGLLAAAPIATIGWSLADGRASSGRTTAPGDSPRGSVAGLGVGVSDRRLPTDGASSVEGRIGSEAGTGAAGAAASDGDGDAEFERPTGAATASDRTAGTGELAGAGWSQRLASRVRPWLGGVVAVWTAGVVVGSLRPLLGWRTLRRLRSTGVEPLGAAAAAAVARIAKKMGVRDAVQVLQSTLAPTPLAIGHFKPLVLLPAALVAGLPLPQLEALLAHELAHIRRRDFLVNLLQTTVETLFFYHPAVWWLSQRMRVEREHCCDDLVVERLGNRIEYGRALLAVEETRGVGTALALGALDGSLLSRVRRIVGVEVDSESIRRRPLSLAGVGLFVLAIVLASTSLSTTSPRSADAAPEPPAAPRLDGASGAKDGVGTNVVGTKTGAASDWPMYGGSPRRNHESPGRLPSGWDRATGRNIVWSREIGTQSFASPVVAGGRVFLGANNGAGLDPRRPKEEDWACLLCLDQATGRLIWQFASPKLESGRDHDWPEIGLGATPCVQGDRLWVVTNRCEVVCLDVRGFTDDQNDGPFVDEPERTAIDADVVWKFDMFETLGVRPMHQAVSSVAVTDGLVLLNTTNGADESHAQAAAPLAPDFLALDAATGRIVWQAAPVGKMNFVGASACGCAGPSPAVATIAGTTQAIFPGPDGRLYAYDLAAIKQGRTETLWQFDCNPKTSRYVVGGGGRRCSIVAAPVVDGDRVYVATGRHPEEGDGPADLWCVDATKRGDLSAELVFNPKHRDGREPIPFKAQCACDPDAGDFTRPNPGSGALWHYDGVDLNGDGKRDFSETLHRSLASPVVHRGFVLLPDYSGLVHCVDARTGQGLWTHDLKAAAWNSCVAANGELLVADQDGDLTVLKVDRRLQVMRTGESLNLGGSVYSAPALAGDTLFVATSTTLTAVREAPPAARPKSVPPTTRKNPAKNQAEDRKTAVRLRFVGGRDRRPLADVPLEFTQGYGDQQQRFGPFRTDDTGTVDACLPPGFYAIHLKPERELPYLPVEALWDGEPRGPRPDLSLRVTATGAEKWLAGKLRQTVATKSTARREPREPQEPPQAPDDPRAAPLTYELLPACELVLRAVDAETGAALEGVEFYEENAVGEDWAHPIEGRNLGAKVPTSSSNPPRTAQVATDKQGVFRRLVGANSGYQYGVWRSPPGYRPVDPESEVEVDIVYGQARAERVFKFARIPVDDRPPATPDSKRSE